jgi:hypothetical protein
MHQPEGDDSHHADDRQALENPFQDVLLHASGHLDAATAQVEGATHTKTATGIAGASRHRHRDPDASGRTPLPAIWNMGYWKATLVAIRVERASPIYQDTVPHVIGARYPFGASWSRFLWSTDVWRTPLVVAF